MKKFLVFLMAMVMLVAVLSVFKKPILRSVAEFLIYEDSISKSDAIIVLSGRAASRGNGAAFLYKQNYASTIVCPGGNYFEDSFLLNDSLFESDITRLNLIQNKVDSQAIITIHYGTSTMEESDTILNLCKEKNWKKIIVVSSRLHTGRVSYVYKKRFARHGIDVFVYGASQTRNEEYTWYTKENELITVNNEYIKYFLYRWKGVKD